MTNKLRVQSPLKTFRGLFRKSKHHFWMMELEWYTRMNDVVTTGLSVKPRSYARSMTTNRGRKPDD